MKLSWYGQACFSVETEQGSIVFDPYLDHYVPGLAPLDLTADMAVCTHEHRDHNAVHLVKLTGRTPTFTLDTLHTFHDPEQGALRGENKIYLLSAEGLRLAHLGDLGCRPTDEQMDALRGVDVMLIPVGGFFTIDAAEANELVNELQPRVVIPMHYRTESFSYDVLATVDDFLTLRPDAVRYPTDTIEITAQTPAQTAVLTYQG